MSNHFRRIQRVLIIVLLLNLVVAVAKVITGLVTSSVSMQADGLHSLVDGSSNLVGLAGIWLAARPADANHPYGHRKYETLASIAIGALLLYTAVEIVREAIERVFSGAAPTVTVTSFVVMLTTLAINIGVTIWEGRQGRALGSDVLLADAAQTRSDIFASLAVIGSLIAAWLGYHQFDALVALGVAALVGYAAWQVLRQAASVLADEVVLPVSEINRVALAVPGVEGTHRVWTRGHEREIYVDLDIRVDAGLTVEQGHALAHAVRGRIQEQWPFVRHIMVHVEPTVPIDATTLERVYLLARQRQLNIHDVRVRATDRGEDVSLHLEVDPRMTLGEAHALADDLEMAVRSELSQVEEVTTHIEGVTRSVERRDDITASRPDLVARIEQLADRLAGPGRSHGVQVFRQGEGEAAIYDLILHCTLPAGLSTAAAHDRAEAVEHSLRAELPGLGAVTVHVEPPE